MADFSVGRAATAGFRLLAKRPLTVFVWGVVYLLIAVVPSMLLMGAAAPGMIDVFKQMAAGADPNNVEGMLSSMASMQAMQPVSMITGIVARALIVAAIFRAVLEPSNTSFFSLRLGMDEFWQGLVQVCLGVILAVVVICVILLFAALGAVVFGVSAAASGGANFEPWMIPVGIVAFLAMFGVIIWLALRFSMAPPMTFAENTFRLFESWTFTRGRVGSLFLTALLMIVLVIGVEMVMAMVFGALALGGLAAAGSMTDLEQTFSRPPAEWLPTLGIVGLIAAPIIAFVTGLLLAITWAPWADAYRQMAGSQETEAALAPAV